MAQPATQNLVLVRGDTETLVITLTDSAGAPIDITGRTYRAQIRVNRDASSIAASFACSITNAAAGQVTCVLSAVNSAALTAGINYWDFEENNAGVVTTILAGTAQVLADVTR
jgi:hypothetical protein